MVRPAEDGTDAIEVSVDRTIVWARARGHTHQEIADMKICADLSHRAIGHRWARLRADCEWIDRLGRKESR